MSACAPSSVAIGRATLLLHDLLAKLFEAQSSLPDWTYVELCDGAKSLHEQLQLAALHGAGATDGTDDAAERRRRGVPMVRIEGVGLVPMASLTG